MPPISPLDRLRAILGSRFEEIAGTSIVGEIPVREGLVNRLIAARLALGDLPIVAARVEAHEDDHVTVRVTTKVPFLPSFLVAVNVERQPVLPADPVLILRWSIPAIGRLALLARPALDRITTPPWIHLADDRVTLDIRRVFELYSLDDLLPYLVGAEVHTRSGGFAVRFVLRVDPD
jgi:hypothetical protein